MKRDFKSSQKHITSLSKALAKLQSSREVEDFLFDACTPNELQSISDRWQVALLIDEGYSYREINELTGVSTATITRVGRSIKQGKGYRNALEGPL